MAALCGAGMSPQRMSLMRTVHVQRTASSAQMPYAAHRKARGRVVRNASGAQCGYALDVRMRQSGYVHALSYHNAPGGQRSGRPVRCILRNIWQLRLRQRQRHVCGCAYGNFSACAQV